MTDELLQFHYLNYRLCIFSPTTYLVSNEENLLRENKFDKSNVASINATIYYEINAELSLFFDKKPAYQLSSSSALLIDTLVKKQQIQKSKVVYAHYFDKYLEIIAFDGDLLLLHNIFPIEQEADFSYYILSTYELLGFSTSLVSTVIFGTITKPSKVYDMLYTYVKDVQFMKKNTGINYTNTFEDIEDHIIYPLTSILNKPSFAKSVVGLVGILLGGLNFKSATKFVIGAFQNQLGAPFNSPEPWMLPYTGKLDELRFYNKALSAQEINAIAVLERQGR